MSQYQLSPETRQRMSLSRTGEKHPNWKGGFSISPLGYRLKKVGHKTYVLEHRHVMEKFLGRKLRPDESVHHVNENKLDNRIENLEIISPSEHAKLHNGLEEINQDRHARKAIGKPAKCSRCFHISPLRSVKYALCRPCYRRLYLGNK